jgi:putative inorganic carbon (HCO3(-)) transporter
MTAIIIYAICVIVFFAGLRRTFVWTLGYIWLDVFRPQLVDPSAFEETSLLMVFGILSIIDIAIHSRKSLRAGWRGLGAVGALLLFAAYVTYTTSTAIVSESAEFKWRTTVVTIIYTAFLVTRLADFRRVALVILAVVSAASVNTVSAGLKTMSGGAGYMHSMGISSKNEFLSESSTLAVFAVSLLPMMWAVLRSSVLFRSDTKWNAIGVVFTAVFLAGSIGTFARSGLVALIAISLLFVFTAKHKLKAGVALVAISLATASLLFTNTWYERMGTISNFSEDQSAGNRIKVWTWIIEYANQNPMGGGFRVTERSVITLNENPLTGESETRVGVSAHSMYMEVLAEQGYVGLALYLIVLLPAVFGLLRAAQGRYRYCLSSSHASLCKGMFLGWVGVLSGGAFIGIAYFSVLYYMLAISIALLLINDSKRFEAAREGRDD